MSENKGRIVYKSKTPKPRMRLVIYTILAITFDYFFIHLLLFFILFLIHVPFPDTLLPSIWFLLGLAVFGFSGLINTSLVILKFITYLKIFENGIEVRLISIIPPKYKNMYISYEEITKVEIIKDKFGIEDIAIHTIDKEPYKLSQYHIDDLKEAKSLILKNQKTI